MHEEALFRDLRRELDALVRREDADRLARVRIWLGALSHVTEARLRSAWPALVAGGPAEGAALEVEVSADPTDRHAGHVVIRSVGLTGRERP